MLTRYWSKFINRVALWGKLSHLYRIRKAKKILKKLRVIAKQPGSGGKVMLYLRKIDPYVFEELILCVIEDSNIRVIRNTRYSGDGGVDGIFKLKKGKVLIQCKRYSNYISHQDVTKLCNAVRDNKYYMGIFVHTGKTGGKSKEVSKEENNILFISGSTLIDLVLGKINIAKYIENRSHFFNSSNGK